MLLVTNYIKLSRVTFLLKHLLKPHGRDSNHKGNLFNDNQRQTHTSITFHKRITMMYVRFANAQKT